MYYNVNNNNLLSSRNNKNYKNNINKNKNITLCF